ncbi:MAG: sulfatase-like hydrolase/transferase [Myxococcota bacterium]
MTPLGLGWIACTTAVEPPAVSPLVFGDRPRDVLMVSIDTLRRDALDPRLAPEGAPFLAGLAADGVWLDDLTQCSDWTFASTSCTLDGRYPETAGFVPQLDLDARAPLPDGRDTLAVRLRDAGYHTILVSTNVWLSDVWNNAQGYDDVSWGGRAASANLEAGAALLAASGADPWLLHVHLGEPHAPYTPPDAYLADEAALPPVPYDLTTTDGLYAATELWPSMSEAERALLEAHLRVRYAGEIRYLDDQLAAWWSDASDAGLLDDALVVVWSDHGEQFWEHGAQSHAYGLAAEENDAIGILWARGLAPTTWTAPVAAVDWVPTILDALDLPADGPLDGFALGRAPADRPRFASTAGRAGVAVSVEQHGWKLIVGFDGSARLYDRTTDPAELVDRYRPDEPHVAGLWAMLAPRIAATSAALPDVPLTWPDGL